MNRQKKYSLDDGSLVTVKEVVKHTGYSVSCIRGRLQKSSSPDKIYRQKTCDNMRILKKNTEKILNNSPFYDDMFRLMMKKI